MSAICTDQVVGIKDPAIPRLYSWVPTPLKGRILLAQSCSEGPTSKDKAIAVIAYVNQSLNQLTRPGDEHWRLEQRRMVSEAVAHLDGYYEDVTRHRAVLVIGPNSLEVIPHI